MSSSGDKDFISQAQAGDIAGMQGLFMRYSSSIQLYLVRLLGEEKATPLTVHTFRSAWEALPGLEPGADFLTWLYRIATNIAYDAQEPSARGLRRHSWPLYQLLALPTSTPPLIKAVLRLPFYERACLVLHVVARLSLAEVAACLGLPERRVRTHLESAWSWLRSGEYASATEEELREAILALPQPGEQVNSPFLAREEEEGEQSDQQGLTLLRLSSSASYTRPLRQRIFLRLGLMLTSLLLVVSLLTSGMALLLVNKNQLVSSGQLKAPPVFTPAYYDARVDRPACFFADESNDSHAQPSICNSHLYSDINQQQSTRPGFIFRLQQAYADANAIGLAYTLLQSAYNNLNDVPDMFGTLSIQELHTSITIGHKYAAYSTFFGQYNTNNDISFFYLPSSPTPGEIHQLHVTLDIHSMWLVDQTTGGTTTVYKGSQPLRFQFTLPFHTGQIIPTPRSSHNAPYSLSQVTITPSMTHVTLNCLQSLACKNIANLLLTAGNSAYLPSDVRWHLPTIDLYYRATSFQKHSTWHLSATSPTVSIPSIYF
ncbi:RNA polymerase sigma factor [Ktedonobacter racemifer]|uniref:RNA polymerase, sigma-24 subunit, ECF subfamily n=1 Tax=Ktedonobacter racemifer DSM 44963 TaxID=485913 RepID=D6TLW9_KTERA|nr:sigma factor-like helix-turn-helix DNA-binding protein [Ktedonobacter racemifer]EFH86769.1 RNA polymerase, sigma-24 subunit, ECF subfamily [Ktedonobacter racemifer DSM 44963]